MGKFEKASKDNCSSPSKIRSRDVEVGRGRVESDKGKGLWESSSSYSSDSESSRMVARRSLCWKGECSSKAKTDGPPIDGPINVQPEVQRISSNIVVDLTDHQSDGCRNRPNVEGNVVDHGETHINVDEVSITQEEEDAWKPDVSDEKSSESNSTDSLHPSLISDGEEVNGVATPAKILKKRRARKKGPQSKSKGSWPELLGAQGVV
ncbi:hypothetical protein EZV62_000807 [Acer yangbiense]|uniref:Uncharacterized protein n=1 Tax=Acer yangbiense TaxID=1000413 RepID=A0A5C7ISY2_9ROSI|nr:hypothetical protein EZV62_000807 [Acer yangbiense]